MVAVCADGANVTILSPRAARIQFTSYYYPSFLMTFELRVIQYPLTGRMFSIRYHSIAH